MSENVGLGLSWQGEIKAAQVVGRNREMSVNL